MPPVDDLAAAVLAAQQGDEHAFGVVYRTVQPGLLRYLGALVGPDAEDVASETWVQICRDLHKFSGTGDGFKGWAATIGRHRALDFVRARRRRPVAAYPAEILLTVPGPEDTAAAAAESAATAAALELIGELPRDQAEAVLLRTVVGLDAATTGRVLGKRPGAVRMAAHRGLRSLAQRLVEPPPDQGVTPGPSDSLNELR
ncbi:MAG: RNA polymerase sigma factor [Actinomycetota bacterium]|nr:RNA polymerase sigma factor [Actinomycetota bacterium]MDQ2956816.1 RNA polymerase sigma factor [Actinomycetota bacterium]